jgi:integrase
MEFSKKDMNKINAVWSIQKQMKSTLREIARKFKIKVFDPSVELANKDKIRNTKREAVYFDFDKIQKIIEYQPSTEALKNTKLILLTLIFTGCRLSDVYKIEPNFTYNKGGVKFDYAQYISQKTDTQISYSSVE